MGKNLHNDDFEDFFKKHLEGFNGEPADDMWERIEPVIPPKPGVTWSAYVLPSALILSLGLLLLVGIKMFEYKKISENLTEQLEQSNREVQSLNNDTIIQNKESLSPNTTLNNSNQDNSNQENLNSDNNNIDNNTGNLNSIANQNDVTVFSKKKTTSSKINQQDFINTINNITFNSTNTNQNYEQTIGKEQVSKIKKTILTTPEIGKEIQKNNEETTSIIDKPVATSIVDWNELMMKPSSILFQNNWQLNKAVTVNKPLFEEVLANRNSITLFVTPTILKNNIRPPRPPKGNNPPPPHNNPPPIPTEKVKIGQAFGVKYGYNLTNKLSLNIGGMYANASYDFNTRHFLPYNKDTEQDISTDKVSNNVDYSGSSTYGEYSIGADITRLKDNSVTQDEEIDIKIDATAKIHSIVIPVYLTYELFETNGFSVGLKGGLSYNNVIKNDLKINDFKIEKQGFEVRNFELKNPPKPSKNGAINMLSGVVLAYAFKDNWSVMIEPTWSSALSDNHKADFGRTKSNMFNVDIGLKYNF
ncbi:MAG: hypothetical protein AB8G11_01520 [Saprospiraceae bacterium]